MASQSLRIIRNIRLVTLTLLLFVSSSCLGEPIYHLPANIQDFPAGSDQHKAMLQQWQWSMNSFALQARTGNPWTNVNDSPRTNYVDYLTTTATESTVVHPITWTAFPNRVTWYFNTSQNGVYKLGSRLIYPLADDGRIQPDDPVFKSWLKTMPKKQQKDIQSTLDRVIENTNGAIASDDLSSFAPVNVPTDICPVVNWSQEKEHWVRFGPAGPRGWKDEYNEWAVTRNADNKIIKVSFTAENPEYWFTLWRVDPNRVLGLYRELVGSQVQMKDLYLRDPGGNVVRDYRGLPSYNPLNKWNYGNRVTSTGGGAVHLTSPPNTVGAEIFLGAAATIIRSLDQASPEQTKRVYSPQQNNCASLYGSSFRNSDPNIGFQANQIVNTIGKPITLTDPVALYMQRPDFSNYQTPDGTPAETFFRVVRGTTADKTGRSYDQILHAVFEVPEDQGYTVSDIEIGGQPIWWGSQIAETFNQALAASAYMDRDVVDKGYHASVAPNVKANPWAQPLVKNKVLQLLNLPDSPVSAATIPLLPPFVKAGEELNAMAIEAVDGSPNVSIHFTTPDGDPAKDIKVTLLQSYSPGESTPLPGQHAIFETRIYVVDIHVGKQVPAGQYGVVVQNLTEGVGTAEPVPAVLTVTN